ncbi:thiol reductant ABC exporter subunit CydD [Nocardia sp. NBC_00565]|uniref:thiol reductant ABC exporter subunit CydD n=1 Tax=Nocardia sp. NBC_00565 TaxID=2975993 RepID=UPI002E8187F4|nr:thiol reductant ABC exporter subunit CydD [Nocardia sp. NBC_00565]WUC02597.1 thiol reductant ABC exporter subunit CydD [Nocardia sp. NBC_00565]
MARPPVDPRLWKYARSARRYLVLSVALSLVITGSIVVTAVALANVLAGVITDPGRRSFGAWTFELIVLAVAIGCRVLATGVQSRLAHRAGATVVAELETAVLDAGARLAPRELETRRTELAVVVSTGLTGLRAYLTGYLPALLLACLVPPIVLVVIAFHDPISGVIAVVTLPLIPVFMILIGLLTQGRAQATLAATTRLSDQLLDLFAGMPTLRALGREVGGAPVNSPDSRIRSMEYRVRELGDALRQRTMRTLRIAFLSSMVLEMLATLSVALIAVSIGLRLVYGEMSLYAGLVALILAPEVYLPLRMVGERFHAAQDGMAAADRAFAVLEPETVAAEHDSSSGVGESAEFARAAPDPGHGLSARSSDRLGARIDESSEFSRTDFAGVIEIRDLTVRARDGLAPAGLSAVLRPDAVTVLTGPNGSGKSTALQAILGLIGPDRGSVTVDGTDVRGLDQELWWSRLAWLPQRPVLVPGTLRENFELLGARTSERTAKGASRVIDELEAACIATGFDAVLDELPHGWDTVVGAGGVGLSLGQRQRLALTRVLAADRPVLLLDEPTAHLDPASEATVLTALHQRARAGATVIVIGHRPSILAAADHLIPVRARTPDPQAALR